MKKGIFYAVGVGPGDPELLTVKAVRILRGADYVAVPDRGTGEHTALNIVAAYVQEKQLLFCPTPMIRDRAQLDRAYDAIADRLASVLDDGKTAAMITLGDPTVYSTAFYVFERLRGRGYEAELVPGVPSFCACAARLGQSLCERSQRLTVIPGSSDTADAAQLPGTKVIMKSGKSISALQSQLKEAGLMEKASAVICCGMEGEQIWEHFGDMQEPGGYFTVVIVKE